MPELTIDSIAAGGDGVGRVAGMVVFVPRTAPGDVLSATLASKGRFARGTMERLERASPDRVSPACLHYVRDRCGGCQLQHIQYEAQLGAKAMIIRDALTRVGKRAADVPPVERSSAEWRYRTKLTLGIRPGGGGRRIGLHPYDDPVGVFQLEDCPITDERVVAIWRQIVGASELLPVEADRGSVRLTDNGSVVVIEGGTVWSDGARFFDAVAAAGTLWWKPRHQPRQVVASRDATAQPAVFAQVNPEVARRLRAYVIDRARSHDPRSVVDAYAGSGATAIELASPNVRVTALELDEAAARLTAAGLDAPSRSIAGRVEDLLPASLPADVVLLNPPRTGLADAVPDQLQQARGGITAVIYVSCNPATLGRDLARMPGYVIRSVRGFDMFPQTAHVETVCELVPEAA